MDRGATSAQVGATPAKPHAVGDVIDYPNAVCRLELHGVGDEPSVHHLTRSVNVVGSDAAADVVAATAVVSRRHLAIHIKPDGVAFVEDLKSRNGSFVYVDGSKQQADPYARFHLRVGDRVDLGNSGKIMVIVRDLRPATQPSDTSLTLDDESPPPPAASSRAQRLAEATASTSDTATTAAAHETVDSAADEQAAVAQPSDNAPAQASAKDVDATLDYSHPPGMFAPTLAVTGVDDDESSPVADAPVVKAVPSNATNGEPTVAPASSGRAAGGVALSDSDDDEAPPPPAPHLSSRPSASSLIVGKRQKPAVSSDSDEAGEDQPAAVPAVVDAPKAASEVSPNKDEGADALQPPVSRHRTEAQHPQADPTPARIVAARSTSQPDPAPHAAGAPAVVPDVEALAPPTSIDSMGPPAVSSPPPPSPPQKPPAVEEPAASAAAPPALAAVQPEASTVQPPAAAPAAAPSTPFVKWQFKSDLRKSDRNASAWTDYSNEDTAKLETLFQAAAKSKSRALNVREPLLNADYRVDFKNMIQYRKDDPDRQRPVRRLEQ